MSVPKPSIIPVFIILSKFRISSSIFLSSTPPTFFLPAHRTDSHEHQAANVTPGKHHDAATNTASASIPVSAPADRQAKRRSRSQTAVIGSHQRSRHSSSRGGTVSKRRGDDDDDQPEYINISNLSDRDRRRQTLQVVDSVTDWKRATIGPDDWYGDDFDYESSGAHAFANDPLLNSQYGKMLDMRYQQHSTPSFQAEPRQMCGDVSTPTTAATPSRTRPSRRTLRDEGRSVTWHADRFKELQILGKKDRTEALLTVETMAEGGVSSSRRSPNRSAEESKIPWSPVKAFEEIRKLKEAPPKNLVQDRRKAIQKKEDEEMRRKAAEAASLTPKTSIASSGFTVEETGDDDDDVFHEPASDSEPDKSRSETKVLIEKQRRRREKFFESVLTTSDSKEGDTSDEEEENRTADAGDGDGQQKPAGRERKRSVKELLSDFERKTKELGMDVDPDLSGSRRRVFSDTETMMFETSSSDDVTFDNEPITAQANRVEVEVDVLGERSDADDADGDATPKLPPRSIPKKLDVEKDKGVTTSPPRKTSASSENQYLPMNPTPSKIPVLIHGTPDANSPYLPMSPPKPLKSTPAMATATSSSRTSLTSSNSGVAILTPTDLLLQAEHARTPSQALVMDHLQKELRMQKQQRSGIPTLVQRPPEESPRYCEIDDDEVDAMAAKRSAVAKVPAGPVTPSHYEYLYKARSATPLHYEVVYQEIPDEEKDGGGVIEQTRLLVKEVESPDRTPQKSMKKKKEPLRPIEGLPDIIGNVNMATAKGNSSSDADDEGGNAAGGALLMTDSFKPASFFLSKKSSSSLEAMNPAGSQTSLHSGRELPQTPTERRLSLDEIQSSARGSVSSVESAASKMRRMHLESVAEVSQTMERRASKSHTPTTALLQLPPPTETATTPGGGGPAEINIRYQSVYNEEGEILEQSSVATASGQSTEGLDGVGVRKVPYYVSDIVSSPAAATTTLERARAVDQLHANMELLDAETEAHLANAAAVQRQHDEVVRKIRETPTINAAMMASSKVVEPTVARSRSLEGLLGDSPAGPRDSVQVDVTGTQHPGLTSPNFLLPARGRDPPPPPAGVPPLETPWNDGVEDDTSWRESLRRASRKHRARSMEPQKEPDPPESTEVPPGYVWDEREQRFYRLNTGPGVNQKILEDPTFLAEGLPNSSETSQEGIGTTEGATTSLGRRTPEERNAETAKEEEEEEEEALYENIFPIEHTDAMIGTHEHAEGEGSTNTDALDNEGDKNTHTTTFPYPNRHSSVY